MSINLLDLVKGQLTDAVVGKAASFLGESTEATQKGLGGALPALLGGLMSKAGSQTGAADLLGMITKPEIGSVLGNVGDLFGGSESGSNLGSSLLNGILGDKLSGVTDLIGNVAGFKNSGSASGLLKMAAPLLMGVVGKQVAGKGLSGLTSLLGSQKAHLEAAAPAGFMDKMTGALGIGNLGDLTGNLGNLASGLTGAAAGAAGAVSGAATDALKGASGAVKGAAGAVGGAASNIGGDIKKGGNKMLPILGAIAALVGAFFIWKSCGSDVKGAAESIKNNVENVASEAGNVVKDGANAAVNAAKDGANAVKEGVEGAANAVVEGADAIYKGGADLVGKTVKGFEHLGAFASKKLKDGSELIVPSKGFEAQLVDFIESDKPADKESWFNLRRVLFQTGSANLDERSMSQIENVAKILKAYPNVNLKLGGYTDNTGSVEGNKVLSGKRAAAVVAALAAKGIDANRLASEGYGVEHPVADNNTAEGRALNRRVAARVSKK